MLCARWGGDAPSVSSSSGDDAHRSLLEISQPAPDTDTQNGGGACSSLGARQKKTERPQKQARRENTEDTEGRSCVDEASDPSLPGAPKSEEGRPAPGRIRQMSCITGRRICREGRETSMIRGKGHGLKTIL